MANFIRQRGRSEVNRFRVEINRLFDDFFKTSPFRKCIEEGEWMPLMDMSETDKEIIVDAEVPGIDPKDIDISLSGRILTLRGERKQGKKENDKNCHQIERQYGSFSRSFELPSDVDEKGVTATCNNGVLEIKLPKTKKQPIKKIEIKAS